MKETLPTELKIEWPGSKENICNLLKEIDSYTFKVSQFEILYNLGHPGRGLHDFLQINLSDFSQEKTTKGFNIVLSASSLLHQLKIQLRPYFDRLINEKRKLPFGTDSNEILNGLEQIATTTSANVRLNIYPLSQSYEIGSYSIN